MKTNHFMIALLILLLAGAWNSTLTFAQQNEVDKIVSELENKGVNVNTIIKRSSKTKKVYYMRKDITFNSKDGKYARQLEKAFDKASEDADQVTSEKTSSSTMNSFSSKSGKLETKYMLSIWKRGTNPTVQVSIFKRDYSVSDNDGSFISEGKDFDGLDWDWTKYSNNMQALNNFDWKGYNERMRQFNEQMSGFSKNMNDFRKKIQDQVNDSLIKSINNPKEYAIVVLPNGAKYYIKKGQQPDSITTPIFKYKDYEFRVLPNGSVQIQKKTQQTINDSKTQVLFKPADYDMKTAPNGAKLF